MSTLAISPNHVVGIAYTLTVADGEVVADGPTRRIITSSPMFAPQIAKAMSPLPLLTVADVAIAMSALSDLP